MNPDNGARIRSGETVMQSDDKRVFDSLLENYVGLGESFVTLVRLLKKTHNPQIRSKLVQELRSLEKKRLELLDQMDNPTK